MKYFQYLILLSIFTLGCSCADQEKLLYDRYIDLSEPQFNGDSIRMIKILKIHKKLYKRHPDNFIYFSNVFQSNCTLGRYEDNRRFVEKNILPDDPEINGVIYRSFYLALNEYRKSPKGNYEVYLDTLLTQNLDHNPLLGYIAARCTNNEEVAGYYFPKIQGYIFEMPEKNIIIKMLILDDCDRFLELYKGICPRCEICDRKYII